MKIADINRAIVDATNARDEVKKVWKTFMDELGNQATVARGNEDLTDLLRAMTEDLGAALSSLNGIIKTLSEHGSFLGNVNYLGNSLKYAELIGEDAKKLKGLSDALNYSRLQHLAERAANVAVLVTQAISKYATFAQADLANKHSL